MAALKEQLVRKKHANHSIPATSTKLQGANRLTARAPDETQLSNCTESHLLPLPPLPRLAHIPGVNARGTDSQLHRIAQSATDNLDNALAPHSTAWNFGLQLINNGFYWEAHEVLEPLWQRARQNSREQHLLRAVIQLANGALKLNRQQPKAARRLAKLAQGYLLRCYIAEGERLLGLSLPQLQMNIDCLLAENPVVGLCPLYEF